MPTEKERPTYKGKLARPMRPIPQPILLAAALIERAENDKSGKASQHPLVKQRAAALDEQSRETLERMMLLFDHYGIENHSNWPALAFALARDHVPGLRIMKDRPGAKTKWTPIDGARLQIALGRIMAKRNVTMTQPARILVKQDPWSAMAKTATTLLRRAQDVDNRWVKMMKDVARFSRPSTRGSCEQASATNLSSC
jgi:hypothetical protein